MDKLCVIAQCLGYDRDRPFCSLPEFGEANYDVVLDWETRVNEITNIPEPIAVALSAVNAKFSESQELLLAIGDPEAVADQGERYCLGDVEFDNLEVLNTSILGHLNTDLAERVLSFEVANHISVSEYTNYTAVNAVCSKMPGIGHPTSCDQARYDSEWKMSMFAEEYNPFNCWKRDSRRTARNIVGGRKTVVTCLDGGVRPRFVNGEQVEEGFYFQFSCGIRTDSFREYSCDRQKQEFRRNYEELQALNDRYSNMRSRILEITE